MSKTREQLVYRALKDLGVLPQGQNPSDEEYDSVDDNVIPVLESLTARDIFYVQDEDAIDDSAFLALGRILAWACAAEFGLAADTALASLAQQAEQHLKNIQSQRPTYKVLEVQAF